MPNKEDWRKNVEERRKEATDADRGRRKSELRLVEQAAVDAQVVTGHESWDRYLSHLQGLVDQHKGFETQLRAALESPDVIDHATLMQNKMALRECRAKIEAWELAIRLPQELMSAGHAAREEREAIERPNDQV
ncbi:MAG: hypothetical protein GY906_24340 [bacterium]|nr:hypothetical protein [bacterium]